MLNRDIDFIFSFSLLNILKTINILHFFKDNYKKKEDLYTL